MNHFPLTIVLAADYAYASYVETTLKSLHAYHKGLKIYLINKDFPQEWFELLNNQLPCLGENRFIDVCLRTFVFL